MIGERVAMGPSNNEEVLEVEVRYLLNSIRSHMQWLKEQIGAFGENAGTWASGSDHMAQLALKNLHARFPEVR